MLTPPERPTYIVDATCLQATALVAMVIEPVSNEWDFGSALELIRLQNQSIARGRIDSQKRQQVLCPGDAEEARNISCQSTALLNLGDFKEIYDYFDRSPGKDLDRSNDRRPCQDGASMAQDPMRWQNSVSGFSVKVNGVILPLEEGREGVVLKNSRSRPANDAISSTISALHEESDLGVKPKQKNATNESRQRREIIHGLTGASDLSPEETRKDQRGKTTKHLKGVPLGTAPPICSLTTSPQISRPERRLQIMRMLNLDGSSSAAGFGNSLHADDHVRSLSLTPPQLKPVPMPAEQGIHVFVDISNILIGFHDALKRHRGISKDVRIPRVPLSFFNLSMILERGRSRVKGVVVGSDNLESVEEARQMGYEVNLLKRVLKQRDLRHLKQRNGRLHHEATSADSESERSTPILYHAEQGVDEILHLKMLESILDAEIPSVIVLATGDAAAAEYSDGFLRMAERALQRGWRVELLAFAENMSAAYRKASWVDQWCGAFTTIELDPFAELLRLE